MTENEISEANTSGSYPIHHCKGYVEEVEQLSLSYETIKRANRCGFNVVDFADCCLKTIKHNVNGNSYDDLAKVVDGFTDAVIPFLRKYEVKDIEVARFQSSDTHGDFVVYLSEQHSGYIIVESDENGEPSVRVTKGMEIWRYLNDPIHIVEAVISAIIVYAEKHQSIKDKWLFTFEDIEEISRVTENAEP
jgi:hypothetical protein